MLVELMGCMGTFLTLVIMLRPRDVFRRALDIMALCDEIETMVKVCGSCKIY
jgi:hypothetical protein